MISEIKIYKILIILLIFAIVLFPANLFAHKIYVFAWAEDGNIFSESKFSSNKPVKNAKVSVHNQSDEIMLTGVTSDKGTFTFKISENIASDITINVDAGMGHMGKWKLGLDEILSAYNGKADKESALIEKDKKIKRPSFISVSAGILIIFIFFLLIAYLKKTGFKKNDRK
jgi:nickel transport protein